MLYLQGCFYPNHLRMTKHIRSHRTFHSTNGGGAV